MYSTLLRKESQGCKGAILHLDVVQRCKGANVNKKN